MARRLSKRLFWVFAAFWGVAAAYHFLGIFGKVNDDPPWRHALFVGIDLLFAYGLLKRPPYFTWLFFFFMVQQYVTHGSKLLDRWEQQAAVDWISLGVLLALPIVFAFLLKEAKANKAAAIPVRQEPTGGGH
ncbi:hypothetical protein BH24BAC1_BH24BAC1_28810 [soil metagenome]